MLGRRFAVIAATLLSITALIATVFATQVNNQRSSSYLTRNDEPGGTPSDASTARNDPDEYAWQLFFYLNRQASNDSAGVPDPAEHTFQDDEPGMAVVWESWALASGGSVSEVFKYPATDPGPWENLHNRQSIPRTTLSPNLTEMPQQGLKLAQALRPVPPPGFAEKDVEIRYNRETYNTIRDHHLWSREGISENVQTAQSQYVDFKPISKAVKAEWVELCGGLDQLCTDTQHYHWRKVKDTTGTHIWGLAALHIMTKDLQHWFWADFLQEDCYVGRKPCGFFKPKPYIGHRKDSTTIHTNGVRQETLGTPWVNYRLMGTQTDFTSAPMSNPRIEFGSKKTSCITCHDYASTCAPKADSLATNNLPFPNTSNLKVLGNPDSSVFNSPPPSCSTMKRPRFVQSDFLWSLQVLAESEKPSR
jgi:hypothetical protein